MPHHCSFLRSERHPVGDARGGQSGYPLRVFRELAELVVRVPTLFPASAPASVLAELPQPLARFLRRQPFVRRVHEIRANAATEASSVTRFYRWFGSLLALNYVRWSTVSCYGWTPLVRAAATLSRWCDGVSALPARASDAAQLLQRLRYLERCGRPWATDCAGKEPGTGAQARNGTH